MDIDFTTFDWNRARSFLVTAEEGSFSAAARALGVAQPTVGRQVGQLEEELGVTLFERVGHSLELTETGLALVDHVRAMQEAASKVALTAAGKSQAIGGTVRISSSETIAVHLLPPIAAELRERYPAIELEFVTTNDTSDLLRREADIALRNFRPEDPDLIAKKLRDSAVWMYATPAYLDRIGRPTTPEALAARAELVGFDGSDVMLRMMNAQGYPFDASNFPLRTGNHLVHWALAKAGVAMCFMMQEVGDAEPALERVLPDLPPPASFPTWLACHRELRTSRRIRVVYDLLAERLGLPSGER